MKALLAGLGFGIVAGLLVAPKRGELIRADLKERAQRAVDSVSEAIASRGETRSLASTTKPFEPRPDSTIEGNKGGAVEVLNSATRDALIGVHGIGQVLADRIIENRPYQKAYEIVEKGIVPESTFVQLRRELLDKSA